MLLKIQLSSDNPSYSYISNYIQMRSESKDLKCVIKDYIESGVLCILETAFCTNDVYLKGRKFHYPAFSQFMTGHLAFSSVQK